MTRAELIERIAIRNKIPKPTVSTVIDAAIDEIKIALAGGGEVVLPGLGKFSVRERAARSGRNPRTGEEIQVDAYKIPYFTASKSFKAAVNPS